MRRWLILSLLLVFLLALYLWPTRSPSFETLYRGVEAEKVQAFQKFRSSYPLREIVTEDGQRWEYLVAGKRDGEAILFLHGMSGAADIWWQQIEALKEAYRIIAVTYPPLDSLEKMEAGVLTILDREGIRRTNVVGTSLGGYFAQFLAGRHPERVLRLVIGNTFPPNDILARENRTIGMLLPFLPDWLVLRFMRQSVERSIYPTSGNDAFTLAYLMEMNYGRVHKAHILARYRCVMQKFQLQDWPGSVLIFESDNDPLINPTLRAQLRDTYPYAEVYTFHDAGHFPYLNRPDEYNQQLITFLQRPMMVYSP
ncbi:MAG: alpha/beta fold hydrolase [Anaerolineales bacterium]